MTSRRSFPWLWVAGLALFAIVIAMSVPLSIPAVPGGIGDHQTAGTAAEVNRIQSAWSDAGLLGKARAAMIADLIFIGVYGAGSVMGGLSVRRSSRGTLRTLGTLVALAGAAFLLTDYIETTSQFIQLTRGEGDDSLARLAATVRPVKIAAWIVTFVGLCIALVWRRRSPQPG